MAALSKRGRRMVFVVFLNLVYFIMVLLIAKSRSNQWDLGLQKSLCNRATPLDKTGVKACDDSKTSTDEVSVSAPVTVNKTKAVESEVGQVEEDVEKVSNVSVSTASTSDIPTVAPVTQEMLLKAGQGQEETENRKEGTGGQVEDRGERQKRDISSLISTSKPQDTHTHQDVTVSETTDSHTFHSSIVHDIATPYLHTTPASPKSPPPTPFTPPTSTSLSSTRTSAPLSATPLSPISPPPTLPIPSLLSDSKTGSVPQTKAEIRTRRDTGIPNKNLESMRIPDDPSRSTPSEVSTPNMIDTSNSHAYGRAQPSSGQGHLHLDITINVTGVTLAVDGVQVYQDLNRTMQWGKRHARLHAGLHLLSLHPTTGHVAAANSFITWQATSDAMFLKALRDSQDGRLLLVAGAPDFTTFLGNKVTEALQDMGSMFADRLAYRDAWCLLLHKGRGVLHEVLVTSRPGHNYTAHHVSPLTTRVTVPRVPERKCVWHAAPGMEDHAAFCRTYDGYGAFCSCHEPPWSPRPASPVPYAVREVIPVAVVTARRLSRVVRQLGQLWASPGGLDTPVMIFVDGHSPEARSLAALLRVPLVEHQNLATPGSPVRINEHIRHVVTQAFRRHPKADKIIVLEDDLDLAPDFIPFFQQTASLLEEDSRLFCVNAYNYNAYNHTAHDPARLYRVHGLPAYGWMVRRRVAEEMVLQWAPPKEGLDWDMWVHKVVMGSRDVLVPEVPRTKHVGGGGAHVTGFEQALYHGRRPLNTLQNVTLDLQRVRLLPYIKTHHNAIAGARVVRLTDHPCKVLPLPTRQVNQTFVIYIDVSKNYTSDAYFVVARCLGLNDRNAHENLQAMYTFPFFGNQLYIVGCPLSPFCLTSDEGDVYKATPKDRKYAEHHPFRRANLAVHISIRVPPLDLNDLVTLTNLVDYRVTY
ncbi:protein O-linked-mannose beta-1,2-N-acetylglucosaminyltransferase 1-like isoform X2 [Portunus trituberculatus]|uniref:protein O-linked-mannose beta-1,2-N-acetylglucosaminyltransferase 1-like isoform X2 n=1 Tax=Portunus trituberculatus TaxID=210409 RepID=UPI001E1D1C12|nr:protein O-linked-mannose beta-1,2-N-acetylglucosaminyltransferase 1-like isoform X2 [Portunus trituberculatus]